MGTAKKVAAGQPLEIPAATWNTLLDAAEAFKAGQQRQSSGEAGLPMPPGIIRVKNTSGADLARFSVLQISGVVFGPADNLGEFQNAPTFTAGTPTSASGSTIITLDPVKAGRVARAIITGTTPVRINVLSEGHTTVGVIAGDNTKLQSGGTAGRILYKETGTGTKWGIVMLAAAMPSVKYARITAKAGTAAPWRYSGVEVQHDGSGAFAPDNFTAVSGGDPLGGSLISLAEIGLSGTGVNPLHIGSVVAYWPMGMNYFACVSTHYKGTY